MIYMSVPSPPIKTVAITTITQTGKANEPLLFPRSVPEPPTPTPSLPLLLLLRLLISEGDPVDEMESVIVTVTPFETVKIGVGDPKKAVVTCVKGILFVLIGLLPPVPGLGLGLGLGLGEGEGACLTS
jgi:hypothetical protein